MIVLPTASAGSPIICKIQQLNSVATCCSGRLKALSALNGNGTASSKKAKEGSAHAKTRHPANTPTTPPSHTAIDQPSRASR